MPMAQLVEDLIILTCVQKRVCFFKPWTYGSIHICFKKLYNNFQEEIL